MHPTRLSAALIINVLGGRVIGGVRAAREEQPEA
jgi:hypothetical protein